MEDSWISLVPWIKFTFVLLDLWLLDFVFSSKCISVYVRK